MSRNAETLSALYDDNDMGAENSNRHGDDKQQHTPPPAATDVASTPSNQPDKEDGKGNATNQNREKKRYDFSECRVFGFKLGDFLQLVFNLIVAAATVIGLVLVIRGGEDTTALVNAAKKQSASTTRLADQTALLANKTTALADSAKKSADATKEMADAAKLSAKSLVRAVALTAGQLERTDRPLITVDVAAAGPVTSTDAGMDFQIQITLTNSGRSEASNTKIWRMLTYGNRELIAKELASTCQIANTLWKSDTGGPLIIGGGRYTEGYRELLNIEMIREHQVSINGATGKFFYPVFVGCVAYSIPYSDQPHHTPFVYNIYQRPQVSTDVWAAYRVGDSVPADAVFFVQDLLIKRKPD
jgi:hypothetical protein